VGVLKIIATKLFIRWVSNNSFKSWLPSLLQVETAFNLSTSL